jgi:hypothetical protein
MLTAKQRYTLNLINKIDTAHFTTEGVYLAQGNSKQLSKKALTGHLTMLLKKDKIYKVRRGNYALATPAAPILNLDALTSSSSPLSSSELPSFLAHEDIEKLLEWKSQSIGATYKEIERLQLKVIKLEKQKTTISNIKVKFC